MHFIDEAKIYLKAGNGGKGAASFRREKFIEFGGPDGGNGGKGGSIIFRAINDLNTLINFRYQQHFKAPVGRPGKGSNCTGSSGDDVIIEVPLGTQIYAEDGQTLLFDMCLAEQEIVIAKGGDGGLGNINFKTSTNRSPRRSTKGWEGEELWVWLKLKLLSDVGLLGLPNAGKSTFLSVVSSARPKISDYPFTTLKPQLGVVYIDRDEFVIADIPGLIEGASEGHGLGHKFLRHLERCTILLHLIDATTDDLISSYNTVYNELQHYNTDLTNKFELIAISKIDLITEDELEQKIQILKKHTNKPVFACSGATTKGIKDIIKSLIMQLRSNN